MPLKLNPFINLVPLTPKKITLKHGLFSKYSFNLEIDKKNTNEISKIINNKNNKLEDTVLVKNLQNLSILVSDSNDEINNYRSIALSNKNIDFEDSNDLSICFFGSKEMHKDVLSSLEGNNINYFFIENMKSLQNNIDKIKKSSFAIVLYDCFDSKLFHDINLFFIDINKDWMLAFVDGSHFFIFGFFLPNETACYDEAESWLKYTLVNSSMFEVHQSKIKNTSPKVFQKTLSNFIASIIFMKLSSGQYNFISQAVIFDFENFSFNVSNINKLPRCSICSQRKSYSFS